MNGDGRLQIIKNTPKFLVTLWQGRKVSENKMSLTMHLVVDTLTSCLERTLLQLS